jgi:heme-degrading monooxygenase HmoA
VIRVIYRWRIEADRRADFATWWHEGTLRIRSTQPGAVGSTLLCPTDEQDCLVGIARWESKEQLTAFWERMSPLVFEGAVLLSLEVLEELDHLTMEGPTETGGGGT